MYCGRVTMSNEEEDDLSVGEKGCLHCMIWDAVRQWAGDELDEREYHGALQAFAKVLADIITYSSEAGNSNRQQVINVFNAMLNVALHSSADDHSSEEETADLSPKRVIN